MIMERPIEKGANLPSAAKLLAVTSYTNFLDRYPVVAKINPEHWHLILTIAGIFVAISQLNHENLPEQDKDAILDIVTTAGIEIYPDCNAPHLASFF